MNLYYGIPKPADFSVIVAQTGDNHLNRLTCSTVPLLCYWREYEKQAAEIFAVLGLPISPSTSICFEYPVTSANAHSKSSFTDVMCISELASVAIEGKWTEGPGETVENWLKRGKHANRQVVLDHWLRLISPSSKSIRREAVSKLPYQMIHRTASACSLRSPQSFVLYQCFTTGRESAIEPSLRAAVEAFNATEDLKFWIQNVPIQPTDFHGEIQSQLAEASEDERPQIVRSAIIDGNLFRFGTAVTKRVG